MSIDLVAGALKRTACLFGESLTFKFLANVLLSTACVSPFVFEAMIGVVDGNASETGRLLFGEVDAEFPGFIEDRLIFAFGLIRLLGRGMSDIGRFEDVCRAGADLGIAASPARAISISGSSGKLSQLRALAVLSLFFCRLIWLGIGSFVWGPPPSIARGTFGMLVLRSRMRACFGGRGTATDGVAPGNGAIWEDVEASDPKEVGRVSGVPLDNAENDDAADSAEDEIWLTGRCCNSLRRCSLVSPARLHVKSREPNSRSHRGSEWIGVEAGRMRYSSKLF